MELEYGSHNCNHEAVIAKFQNGRLIDKSALKDVKHYSKVDRFGANKRKNAILVSETDRLQYVGTNFGPARPTHCDYSRYYIGIANKKTNKVKLMDCSYFDLKPSILGSVLGPETIADTEKKMPSRFEQKDNLTLAFGSLRKQRATNSRLRNSVLGTNLNGVEGMTFSMETPDTESNDIFFPINREAVRAADVYDLETLFPKELDLLLDSCVDEFLDVTTADIKKWREEKKFQDLVLECLSVLPAEKQEKLKMAKIVMYIHFMLLLANIRSPTELMKCGIPFMIRKFMIKTFCEDASGQKFKQPSSKSVYKLKAYVLALVLILRDYEVPDIVPLAKSTNLNLLNLQTLVNGVGATWVSQGKNKFGIKLKLPLPPLRRGKSKNRKV